MIVVGRATCYWGMWQSRACACHDVRTVYAGLCYADLSFHFDNSRAVDHVFRLVMFGLHYLTVVVCLSRIRSERAYGVVGA